MSVYSLLCSFPISVILALCLNCVRVEKFKKTVQTVTYIPHFFSLVVVVGMMTQISQPALWFVRDDLEGDYGDDGAGHLRHTAGVFPYVCVVNRMAEHGV